MPQEDITRLVAQITDKHPFYGRWVFEYVYPGYFAYHLNRSQLSIFFTPDHTTKDVIDIQVDRDGQVIDTGEAPFTKRTAENLFNAVKPWLEKYDA